MRITCQELFYTLPRPSAEAMPHVQEKVSNLEDHVQYHQDLKTGKPAAVRRLQHAACQAAVRAASAEDMSHELHWQLQVRRYCLTLLHAGVMVSSVPRDV